MNSFRELIQTVLLTLKWSQRRLALSLGVSNKTVHDWLHGAEPRTQKKREQYVDQLKVLIHRHSLRSGKCA